MNHLLEFNEYNICDGCQYFDMQSLYRYYPAYENPLYSLLWKKTIEELIYISPKEYIQRIAKGFKQSYEFELEIVNNNLVNKYIENFKKGDKFPICYYTENSSAQEGRHRVVAMMKMGIKTMPIIRRKENISKRYINNIVNEIKDLSRDEVNQYYINKGYQGINDVDWNELQNYIKYPERY
jgi:RNase H-fold protein (predicted Holliday junction resolvase)